MALSPAVAPPQTGPRAATLPPIARPAAPPSPSCRQEGREKASPRWALALTAAAFFMASLDLLVVMTALPAIQRQLRGSMTSLEWTVNAYSLASAAGIVTAAALGDRFGRRRIFTLGLALFTAASAACAFAPTVTLLILSRAVQGIGGALISPTALTILVSAFPPRRRGAIIGLWGGIAGLAIAGGPLVGGVVTQGLDWRWIFLINVPIGIVAATLALRRLPESYGPATRLDLPAVTLVTSGALSLVWGLAEGNTVGWANPDIIAALGGGVLLLIAFVAWERHASAPMLPLRLFRNRSFAAANATAFFSLAALLATAFLITQYLQTALGFSPLQAGLRFLPMTATPLVVAPFAGRLADRLGPRPVMVAGLFLFAAGLGALAQAAAAHAGYARLWLPLLLAGVGVSLPFAVTPAAALGAVAPDDTGKASGVLNTFQRFGGVFGIAASAALFTAHAYPATSAGFTPALSLAAGFALLGALGTLAVGARRTTPPAASGGPPDAASGA